LTVAINRVQTQPNLKHVKGVCHEWVRGITLHYTVNPSFKLLKINVFHSSEFNKLIFESFDADDHRDHICSIMASNCTNLNNTSSTECSTAYDKLNMTDDGYLDGNTKGCRLLHASFVPNNMDHCPHLSFTPLVDKMGLIKCQESKGRKNSDLFSQFEVTKIQEKGNDFGFPLNLTRPCLTIEAPNLSPTEAPTFYPSVSPTKAPTTKTPTSSDPNHQSSHFYDMKLHL